MSAGPATTPPAHDLPSPDALGPWTRRVLFSSDAFVYERLTTDGRLGALVIQNAAGWSWFTAMTGANANENGCVATAEDGKRAADEAIARLDGTAT